MFRRVLHLIATLTILLAFVHQLPLATQHQIVHVATTTVVTSLRHALAVVLDALATAVR